MPVGHLHVFSGEASQGMRWSRHCWCLDPQPWVDLSLQWTTDANSIPLQDSASETFLWCRRSVSTQVQSSSQGIYALGDNLQPLRHSFPSLCGTSGRHVLQSSVKSESVSTQSCLILCDPMDCSPSGSSSMEFSGKNTGVGSLSLLQGIFPTQGSNPGLPHCRQILYLPSHRGSAIELFRGSPSGVDWSRLPTAAVKERFIGFLSYHLAGVLVRPLEWVQPKFCAPDASSASKVLPSQINNLHSSPFLGSDKTTSNSSLSCN